MRTGSPTPHLTSFLPAFYPGSFLWILSEQEIKWHETAILQSGLFSFACSLESLARWGERICNVDCSQSLLRNLSLLENAGEEASSWMIKAGKGFLKGENPTVLFWNVNISLCINKQIDMNNLVQWCHLFWSWVGRLQQHSTNGLQWLPLWPGHALEWWALPLLKPMHSQLTLFKMIFRMLFICIPNEVSPSLLSCYKAWCCLSVFIWCLSVLSDLDWYLGSGLNRLHGGYLGNCLHWFSNAVHSWTEDSRQLWDPTTVH